MARNQYHNLCQTVSIRNLGLEHFYAAFGLGCSRDLRTSSARAFGISDNDISEDCTVPSLIATGLKPLTHGTPRETHIQRKAKIDPQETEAQPLQAAGGLGFHLQVKRWQADATGCCPVLQSRINVDWLTFDPQMFAPTLPQTKRRNSQRCVHSESGGGLGQRP